MDQPPKESTDSSILDEIKQALLGADRCIELARKQRDLMTNTLPSLSAGGMEAANQVLEHAREEREKLEALELQVEVTPPPSLVEALPPSLESALPPFGDSQPADLSILDMPVLEEQAGPA